MANPSAVKRLLDLYAEVPADDPAGRDALIPAIQATIAAQAAGTGGAAPQGPPGGVPAGAGSCLVEAEYLSNGPNGLPQPGATQASRHLLQREGRSGGFPPELLYLSEEPVIRDFAAVTEDNQPLWENQFFRFVLRASVTSGAYLDLSEEAVNRLAQEVRALLVNLKPLSGAQEGTSGGAGSGSGDLVISVEDQDALRTVVQHLDRLKGTLRGVKSFAKNTAIVCRIRGHQASQIKLGSIFSKVVREPLAPGVEIPAEHLEDLAKQEDETNKQAAKQLASVQAAFRRPTFARGGSSNGGGGGNKKKKGKAKPGKAAANPSPQPQA